ncbi:MAG: 50S ribosomal protein L22 [Candidatus Omnitrophica bacterium]|nr:50S ribosomal protein L22 [Candidatus Omnitrophota bacterium]
MVTRAEAKYIRISPFKVRGVMKLIKGEKVGHAMALLYALNKKGAVCVEKVLKSAIANAKNRGYDENKLFISNIIANPGPALKRHRAASFGRATMIKKRTSHILVELDTKEKIIQNTKSKK